MEESDMGRHVGLWMTVGDIDRGLGSSLLLGQCI